MNLNNEIPDGEIMKYKYRNGNNISPVCLSPAISTFLSAMLFYSNETNENMRRNFPGARLWHVTSNEVYVWFMANFRHFGPYKTKSFRLATVYPLPYMAWILIKSGMTSYRYRLHQRISFYSLKIANWRELSRVFGSDFFFPQPHEY